MTKVVYLGAKTNKNKTRIKGKNPIKKKQNVKKFYELRWEINLIGNFVELKNE